MFQLFHKRREPEVKEKDFWARQDEIKGQSREERLIAAAQYTKHHEAGNLGWERKKPSV